MDPVREMIHANGMVDRLVTIRVMERIPVSTIKELFQIIPAMVMVNVKIVHPLKYV